MVDMTDDSLPEIMILGGGPIGIETALYARFLGFPVTVLECDDVCANVRAWGAVTLFTPFGMNHSSLGRSALLAQDPEFEFISDGRLHSGNEWVDRYFAPLAKTDLLRDSVKTQTRVIHVSRDRQSPTQNVGDAARQDTPLRVLFEDDSGIQHSATCDVVIDTTGTWNQPNWMGSGGGPALGEIALRRSATAGRLPAGHVYTSHTIDDRQLADRQGDRFVIVGNGYTAATNLRALETARANSPDLHCVWLTRDRFAAAGPLHLIHEDPLPARRQLAEAANRLATRADWVQWYPESTIQAVELAENEFRMEILGKDTPIMCDHLLSSVGFHANFEMLDSLQVHRCYASGGPMNWAVSIAGNSGDCMQQFSSGSACVTTSEPGFFVIGSKSYGRDSRFLFATGLQQIRDVFRVIGNRQSLDLYKPVGSVAPATS